MADRLLVVLGELVQTTAGTWITRPLTLKTYAHLWPDANDRTRNAASALIDQSLGAAADALRTERP